MDIAKVDSKGRISIPANIRGQVDMHPGDVFVIEVEDSILRLAKVDNPFDRLAERAIAEYEAGETVSLRAVAEQEGIHLDDE
jgi:AbrB family looped-hinge helix DNA binding protein